MSTENSIHKVFHNNMLIYSNTIITPDIITNIDIPGNSLNLNKIYDHYINTCLPGFFEDSSFVCLLWRNDIQNFVALDNNDNRLFQDLSELYRDVPFILREESIYEREIDSHKYYLAIMLPTSESIPYSTLDILSFCEGIEVNGHGWVFKNRKELNQFRDLSGNQYSNN